MVSPNFDESASFKQLINDLYDFQIGMVTSSLKLACERITLYVMRDVFSL